MRRAVLPLLGLLVLILGVADAGGRTLDATPIIVQVIGKGRVDSSPSAVHCGGGDKTCYITFSSDLTLTATKTDDEYSFNAWSGDCTPSGNTCTISGASLNGVDHVVTATFSAPATTSHTLTVTRTGTGTVSAPQRTAGTQINCSTGGADCSWTAVDGSTLTVFQSPGSDQVFTGWGGSCSDITEACTVQLEGDRQVSASWVAATATHTLTVTVAGGGNVSGGGINCLPTCTAPLPQGTTVVLTADPDDGYILTGWSGAGCTGTGTCKVTMGTADVAVTATFGPALSVEVVGSGAVTGGSGAINCGSGGTICAAGFAVNASVSLVATQATGATFLGWTGACGGTATTCTVLMNQPRSVKAVFSVVAPTPPPTSGFTLTVTVSGNGSVSGGGISCGLGSSTCSSANHAANSTVTLTATPGSGATFTGWGGSCTGTTTTCTVTFNAAKSVTATFSGGTSNFQLSVAVTGAGSVSGGGISCGNGASTCSVSVASGTVVTLTATPATGATFTGWGGSCTGTARTCTITVSSARSVTATFSGGAGAAGTLTIVVGGRGTVSSSAGKCTAAGAPKTCTQRFKSGAKVTLTATPSPGNSFLGWSGACAGTKTATCTVTLTSAKTVNANFSNRKPPTGGGGNAVLASLAKPTVAQVGTGFRVTLRFRTSVGGVAEVRGLRAGRVTARISLRVAAGPATIGPFPVSKPGLYTFELQLGGRTLRWTACLGVCGAELKDPPFIVVREAPTVGRQGDVWSVTLHFRTNLLTDAGVRAFRGTSVLVNQRFLGHTGEIAVGPFLLGRGNYTLRVTLTDPYGRVRTLTWIVALA